jgi:hypothetical protein
MNELKVTKENVLKVAAMCEEWKEGMEILFPELFVKEVKNEKPSFAMVDDLMEDFEMVTVQESMAGSGAKYLGNGTFRMRLSSCGVRVHIDRSAVRERDEYFAIDLDVDFLGELINKLNISGCGIKEVDEYPSMCPESDKTYVGNKEFRVRREGSLVRVHMKRSAVRERENYIAVDLDVKFLNGFRDELTK